MAPLTKTLAFFAFCSAAVAGVARRDIEPYAVTTGTGTGIPQPTGTGGVPFPYPNGTVPYYPTGTGSAPVSIPTDGASGPIGSSPSSNPSEGSVGGIPSSCPAPATVTMQETTTVTVAASATDSPSNGAGPPGPNRPPYAIPSGSGVPGGPTALGPSGTVGGTGMGGQPSATEGPIRRYEARGLEKIKRERFGWF